MSNAHRRLMTDQKRVLVQVLWICTIQIVTLFYYTTHASVITQLSYIKDLFDLQLLDWVDDQVRDFIPKLSHGLFVCSGIGRKLL